MMDLEQISIVILEDLLPHIEEAGFDVELLATGASWPTLVVNRNVQGNHNVVHVSTEHSSLIVSGFVVQRKIPLASPRYKEEVVIAIREVCDILASWS